MQAKARQESLARLAIQDPGQWTVWSEAEQQKQLKEPQFEATTPHQPQPDPKQLKLLCDMYVEQAKQLGKSPGTVKEAEPIHSQVSSKDNLQQRDMMARNHQQTRNIKTRNHQQQKKSTGGHKHKGARRVTKTMNNQLKVKRNTRKMGKT